MQTYGKFRRKFKFRQMCPAPPPMFAICLSCPLISSVGVDVWVCVCVCVYTSAENELLNEIYLNQAQINFVAADRTKHQN